MDLVLDRTTDPGRVFDLELPLADVAEGYGPIDERRAIRCSGSNLDLGKALLLRDAYTQSGS
ncbi:medium-chain dehydrogenase/reductase MDR family protein (plasmid) [Rhizobium gallicum]|uniref:Medium-chain dehydrogenase/reductase MDR family protein n=1 Tax=Rhizobium gallicum TaxID=56730 RepID=A0A1L5NT00_9HYPH|nr:medium-chain dehydrogenase/reductase MDR family protein [Rhizobium gallicum]